MLSYYYELFYKNNTWESKQFKFFQGPNDLHERVGADAVPGLSYYEGSERAGLVRFIHKWSQVRYFLPYKKVIFSCLIKLTLQHAWLFPGYYVGQCANRYHGNLEENSAGSDGNAIIIMIFNLFLEEDSNKAFNCFEFTFQKIYISITFRLL